VTRGLLLGAVLQAVEMIGHKKPRDGATVMLDPDIQRVVLGAWQSDGSNKNGLERKWFERESRGAIMPWRRAPERERRPGATS